MRRTKRRSAIPLYKHGQLTDVPIRRIVTAHTGPGSGDGRRRLTAGASNRAREHVFFERDRGTETATPEQPPEDLLREAIAQGFCWWCGKEGMKSLAGHTSQAHGVDRFMLRDWAGMLMHQPVSPALSTQCRERAIESGLVKQVRTGSGRKKKKKMTTAGKRINREKILAASSDETRRAASQIRAAKYFIVRPCNECGTLITKRPSQRTEWKGARLTCSPECRKVIRQRTQLLGAATRRLGA